MIWIHDTIAFVADKTPYQLLQLFWYFILFEFTRYIITDIFTVVFYFDARFRNRNKRARARRQLFMENPLVSVLVPGKNEGRHIPALCHSLDLQTFRNLERIVVDDGSDDETPEICRSLQRQGRITKFFRNEIRGGKASAANLALRYSTGRFVIHLDADSHLAPDAIETILIHFYMDPMIGAVGGDVRVRNIDENFCTWLQGIDYMKSITVGRTVASTMGILRIISGAYGAFRTDVLHRVMGWDVGPGLDGDITLKIRKIGFRVIHEPLSACYTAVPVRFKKLAKQRFRWDRSFVRFRLRRHRDLFDFRNKNWNLLNFLTVVDNTLYNFVFNINWWIYIFHIFLFYTEELRYILIINYILYTFSNLIQFITALLLTNRTLRFQDLMLIGFVPLMPLYGGVFLRFIRTYSHLMELLYQVSFEDPWNPAKVSDMTRTENRPPPKSMGTEDPFRKSILRGETTIPKGKKENRRQQNK